MTQGEEELAAAYILRIKDSLKTLDLEQNIDMAVDALFEEMRPRIWLSTTYINKKKYPWSKLVSKLIQIKYNLVGATHTRHVIFRYADMVIMEHKISQV